MITFENEIIVDNFAGGGGTSTGIEMAIGRPVDVAINHDPIAIAMHKVNHPGTFHYCENVWDVDPRGAAAGRPVALVWLSPDCKHFSKAKGGKPVEKSIRGLAWVAVRWAATVKPRVIILENVEEFCFPPETTVLSKRGVIPIGDVKVGDEVWTHNARWKPVTAKEFYNKMKGQGHCWCVNWNQEKHRWYARYDPAECARMKCNNDVCVLTGKPIVQKKANVFYDLKVTRIRKDGSLFDGEKVVSITKGIKVFPTTNVPITICEAYVKLKQKDLLQRIRLNMHTELFFNPDTEVEVLNVRAERRESRDLLQDLRDIQEGVEVVHASDLQKQKKEAYRERKAKRKETKERKIERQNIESWKRMALEGVNRDGEPVSDVMKDWSRKQLERRGINKKEPVQLSLIN